MQKTPGIQTAIKSLVQKVMASANFVVLRLGSFSFFLDTGYDNCSKNEVFLKAKFKFYKKVKECINAGIKFTLNNEKDVHFKSFALLKMSSDGVLCIYNKKKIIYQHQLFGLQLWNCREISESCFALMVRLDPAHYKKSSENDKRWKSFEKSRNNGMTFVCHVFMIDALISDHTSHCHVMGPFGIKCHFDLKSGKCFEFPSNFADVVMGLKSHFGFKRVSDLFLDANVYSASSIGGDLFNDVGSSPSSTFWRGSSLESLLTLNQAPEKSDPHLQISLDAFLSEINKNLKNMGLNCSRHKLSPREASVCQSHQKSTDLPRFVTAKPPLLFKRKLHDQRTPFFSTGIWKEERCMSTPPVLDTFSEEEEDNNNKGLNRRRGTKSSTNTCNEKMCFYDSDSGVGALNGNRWRDWRKLNKMNECIKIENLDPLRGKNISHETHVQSFSKERQRVSTFLKQVAASKNVFGKCSSKESLASSSSKPPFPPSLPQCKPLIERIVSSRAATWGVSFENLFSDPVGLILFNEFLRREFSIENMTFWKRCEDYKKMSDEQRKEEAQNIYSRHFSIGAVDPINVDHEISTQVKRGLVRANPDLFDNAQKHIYLLMKQDIYPRFKKSDFYKHSIIAELEGKSYFSEGLELSEDCQKMTKRGKSLLFWQKRKLPKTNTIADMRGITLDHHDIYKPQINEKLTLRFPGGKSLVISFKSIKAFQMSLREVMAMHQDKIKPGINFYEAVDPSTGQVVSLDDQLISLGCSNLEMIRCSVFRADLPHSKIIVKSRMGTCLGECMEPVLRMHCPGTETHVFELGRLLTDGGMQFLKQFKNEAGLGYQLSSDTTVDALDRQHIVVYCKDFPQAGHGTAQALLSCKRMPDSLHASLGMNLDLITFDKCTTFDIGKLSWVEGQKFLKQEFQSSRPKLFNLIKRNNSDGKKPQQAMRIASPPSADILGLVTVEMSEPAFDDDTLLDLIQSSQCRTIENQRYGALHKSMPSFLENEEL